MLKVGSVNVIRKSSHSLRHTRKLLHLRLINYHLWFTIVKYHGPIPSLSMDIPLGTKVPLLSTNSCMLFFLYLVFTCKSFVMSKFFQRKLKDCSNLTLVHIFDYCTSKCGHLKALAHNAWKSIETSMLPIFWSTSFYHFHSRHEFTRW
jgi:hypothetical protein